MDQSASRRRLRAADSCRRCTRRSRSPTTNATSGRRSLPSATSRSRATSMLRASPPRTTHPGTAPRSMARCAPISRRKEFRWSGASSSSTTRRPRAAPAGGAAAFRSTPGCCVIPARIAGARMAGFSLIGSYGWGHNRMQVADAEIAATATAYIAASPAGSEPRRDGCACTRQSLGRTEAQSGRTTLVERRSRARLSWRSALGQTRTMPDRLIRKPCCERITVQRTPVVSELQRNGPRATESP